VTEVVPILRVADARVSAAFYSHLGFEFDWEHQFEPGFPLFVSVRAETGARLFLSEHRGDASPDTLVYLYVDDVDALYARLREAGIAVERPPEDMPWGVREIALPDPDRNRLRIGTLLAG
jgi:catechol 2,3-dioxygenase-like lactoylglutathione lyase family enzyme